MTGGTTQDTGTRKNYICLFTYNVPNRNDEQEWFVISHDGSRDIWTKQERNPFSGSPTWWLRGIISERRSTSCYHSNIYDVARIVCNSVTCVLSEVLGDDKRDNNKRNRTGKTYVGVLDQRKRRVSVGYRIPRQKGLLLNSLHLGVAQQKQCSTGSAFCF